MRFSVKQAGTLIFVFGLLALQSHAGDLSPISPVYKIEAGLDGEIYPFLANYASLQKQNQRRFAALTVTISNPTSVELRQRVSVQLPGWSDAEVQTVEVQPGATQ